MSTRGTVYRAGNSEPDIVVPFTWNDVEYRVPAREFRHLKADCPGLLEVKAAGGWVDRVENNMELRVSTVRCTAGCWFNYERTEARKAGRGDSGAALDRRMDAFERREQLAARIDEGRVPGAERVAGPSVTPS